MSRLPLRALVLAGALGIFVYSGFCDGTPATAGEANPASCPDLVRQAKAKQGLEAIALWERVVELNPVVGDYWSRLARAYYVAEQYRKAIGAREKALELRAGYPWNSAYDIACCYALLGEKEQAMKWLDKSFALGFRSLDFARRDDDLKPLHDDPRFRELVALVDPAKMTRTEGWRYDVGLMVRELKRVHFDLSKKASPAGFDAAVQKLLDEIPQRTDHEIEVALMKIVRMAGDGHTVVHPQYTLREHRKAVPVEFYLFGEGLFITSAAPAHKDVVGLQVSRIGEHTVPEVLQALDGIISRDNEIWPRYVAPRLMRNPQLLNGLGLVPDDSHMTLTLRDAEGKERVVVLQADAGEPGDDWVDARAAKSGPAPLYLKNRKAHYWFEFLPESKTVYFQYNTVLDQSGESLQKFCGRLFDVIDKHDVDRLVIDMRWNAGGNNFLNRPLLSGLIRCDKVNRRGKLFVVVGRNTFSAAQCGATQIERYTEATFVGEPTGSCPNFVGESVTLNLPYSKMRASISDLYWQNSVAMDYRTWIGPEIYTPPTFAAYRANRDPALEAILAYRPAAEPGRVSGAAPASGE